MPTSNPCACLPVRRCPFGAQVLQLKDERGRLLAVLDDDGRKLGYYSPQDGFTLHIIDTDPTSLSGAGVHGGEVAQRHEHGAPNSHAMWLADVPVLMQFRKLTSAT